MYAKYRRSGVIITRETCRRAAARTQVPTHGRCMTAMWSFHAHGMAGTLTGVCDEGVSLTQIERLMGPAVTMYLRDVVAQRVCLHNTLLHTSDLFRGKLDNSDCRGANLTDVDITETSFNGPTSARHTISLDDVGRR